jgi:hypothetical protein
MIEGRRSGAIPVPRRGRQGQRQRQKRWKNDLTDQIRQGRIRQVPKDNDKEKEKMLVFYLAQAKYPLHPLLSAKSFFQRF